MLKNIILILLSLTLFSCMTVNNSNIEELPENKGIVLFNIDSPNMSKIDLYYQKHTGSLDFNSVIHNSKSIMNRHKFDILILTEGNYIFTKIGFEGKLYDLPKHESFIVESGKVNYIGDLKYKFVRKFAEGSIELKVELNNDTITHAQKKYPALMKLEQETNILQKSR